VEYATREQAQQAIQTLSNQSLMGRLVYVREVCALALPSILMVLTARPRRIAKLSPDLLDLLPVAATTVVTLVVATVVAVADMEAVPWEVVRDSSTSPMCVPSPVSLLTSRRRSLTFPTATLQCWLAGSERPLPASR
jgi:hypothetical protein